MRSRVASRPLLWPTGVRGRLVWGRGRLARLCPNARGCQPLTQDQPVQSLARAQLSTLEKLLRNGSGIPSLVFASVRERFHRPTSRAPAGRRSAHSAARPCAAPTQPRWASSNWIARGHHPTSESRSGGREHHATRSAPSCPIVDDLDGRRPVSVQEPHPVRDGSREGMQDVFDLIPMRWEPPVWEFLKARLGIR